MKLLGPLGLRAAVAAWGASAAVIVACGPDAPPSQEGTGSSSRGESTTSHEPLDGSTSGAIKLDVMGLGDHAGPPECIFDGSCERLDVLFVIDNSSTMAQEQLGIARNLPLMIEELMGLTDPDGRLINPDVNIMVTTSDMGHPLCTPLQKPGYEPRAGAPVYDGCNARIERFTGLDPMDPVVIEEACTEGCPVDVVPEDHFIHFGTSGSNVPDDAVAAALACIGPQGIDGCGYEAPLESMLRALDLGACWNDPEQPACDAQAEWANTTRGFLRMDAALAIVMITDGTDCSVAAPDGYSFFTDAENPIYWNIDPGLGIPQPSAAICANAGVSCTDDDGDGIHEGCTAVANDVLHPVERYTSYLDQLTQELGKEVIMLGILGVPEVLEHSPNLPYHPIAGGVFDLQYRDWIDAPYPAGDILPEAWDAGRRAADEIFELGSLAPGCVGADESTGFIGHALPPVRVREVCESLSYIDEDTGEEVVRCCIESICDGDFSPAMRCIVDLLYERIYAE